MKEKICSCVNKRPILFCFLVCICTLGISSIFVWDDNPVTGWDKLVGDACITFFCMIFLWCLGLWKKAGFTCVGLGRGLIHLPNVFFMSPLTVVVQAVNAVSTGVLFAVIYLKN